MKHDGKILVPKLWGSTIGRNLFMTQMTAPPDGERFVFFFFKSTLSRCLCHPLLPCQDTEVSTGKQRVGKQHSRLPASSTELALTQRAKCPCCWLPADWDWLRGQSTSWWLMLACSTMAHVLRLWLHITVTCIFSILRLDRTGSAHHPGHHRASALSEVKDYCQISAFLFTDQSPMSDISPHCWPSLGPNSA